MTILILHGIDGKAGDHWEQWIHDELQKKGHTVATSHKKRFMILQMH